MNNYGHTDLYEVLKEISKDSIDNGTNIKIIYGKVTNDSPLEIWIDPKITLDRNNLVLTQRVTEHEMEYSIEDFTEDKAGGSGDSSYASHNHEYKGRKIRIEHAGLKIGDKVVMIRFQGGQKFLVIDRVA